MLQNFKCKQEDGERVADFVANLRCIATDHEAQVFGPLLNFSLAYTLDITVFQGFHQYKTQSHN